MAERDGASRTWFWLTFPTAGLIADAAGSGVFVRALFWGTPCRSVQARGQGVITLSVILAILSMAVTMARAGLSVASAGKDVG